ncbi:MAG: hypothetical protein AAB865_02345 [Patescibacteria group bacterium]
MIRHLTQLFKTKSKPKTDFSEFFISASEQEQKKLFTKVLRAANQDQKEIADRYERLQAEQA